MLMKTKLLSFSQSSSCHLRLICDRKKINDEITRECWLKSKKRHYNLLIHIKSNLHLHLSFWPKFARSRISSYIISVDERKGHKCCVDEREKQYLLLFPHHDEREYIYKCFVLCWLISRCICTKMNLIAFVTCQTRLGNSWTEKTW